MSNLDPVVQIGDWYYQVIYGQLWPISDQSADMERMVRLEPRLHSLLNFFLLHPNTLLAKDTLIEKVWPVDEGTDAAVMRAVGALRKILGDDVRTPLYIATVSKKGYCWLIEPRAATFIKDDCVELDTDVKDDVAQPETSGDETWSWRFIFAAAATILICCASLAYVLASFTATPLIKLPDTISPVSALSGQEYWPVLNNEQSKVIYQHQRPGQNTFNWALQQLSDLRVQHLPEQYVALSQAHWLNEAQIVFSASTTPSNCHFYKQTIQPEIFKPVRLRSCQKVFQQGLLPWQNGWVWLDNDEQGLPQLWAGSLSEQANLLATLPLNWRAVENILLFDTQILLLVQETENNSALYNMNLTDQTPSLVKRFHYEVDHFSRWDDRQLLLSPLRQELQLIDVDSLQIQGLGPITRELTHAVRHPGQVMATQYLDYTTDIFRVENDKDNVLPDLTPWHVSNRSERLLAWSEEQIAFVSERAGHSQIWLATGQDSVQISRLNEHQYLQQILWHQSKLLVLINDQLFQLDPTTSDMTLYEIQVETPGRFSSCDNTLFWTALTTSGWQLFKQHGDKGEAIKPDVVDVRCGPDNNLVLQFVDNAKLGLFELKNGTVEALPISLDWRDTKSDQWFTDPSGLYWLMSDSKVGAFKWSNINTEVIDLPQHVKTVAIYSDGKGLGFVVQPRLYDTDIVWLQNRR